MTEGTTIGQLSFHAVTAGRWPDFERLFESRGGLVHGLAGVTGAGPNHLLGYLAEEPVAWCAIAPRSSYRRLPLFPRRGLANPRNSGAIAALCAGY